LVSAHRAPFSLAPFSLAPAALAGLLALAAPVAAQDSQYWNIQYGPAGQLLGGQVVGSTRDLSATYYNPGGLILGDDPDFLLSVQGFKKQTLTTKPVDGGTFLDNSDTEWGTFPGFVAFAAPESWLGQRTRLAFSILTRQEAVQRVDQRFTGNTAGGGRYGLEMLFDQHMRETWGGLTLSRRIGDRWGLGGTLYGVYRGQRIRLEQNLQLTYPNGDGVSALVINDFDYGHWRVLGKIGLAWEGDAFRLGATVTTPGAGLFGSGNAGFTRSATGVDLNGDGRPDSVLANGLDEDLDATYESSWSFAGGGAWRRGSLQLHVSAEYFAPVDRFTVLQGQNPTPLGEPIALTQRLESVLNAGVGVEYWLGGVSADAGARTHGTVLYGAFATDFTASPDVQPGEASSSNQDLYHLTAGTAFSVGSSRFSLGLSYAFGSKRRILGLGGLPPQVPIFGEGREADVSYSRLVFVVGYLFGK
jgi:hypothetical protein